MPDFSQCEVCHNGVKKDERVCCDLCKAHFHGTCADLSRQEVACLRGVNRRLQFFCRNCNLLDTLKMLQNDVKELKEKLSERDKKQQGETSYLGVINESQTISDNQLFDELEERQRRGCNVIINNLPEPDESTVTANDKQTYDLNSVTKLISLPGVENIEIIKCYRIGKTVTNKPRPIRVILSSAMTAKNVIVKYKAQNGIYVNRDLTKMQQNRAYTIRKEFKRRLSVGDKDIKLKYMNGIPQIVSTKNQ